MTYLMACKKSATGQTMQCNVFFTSEWQCSNTKRMWIFPCVEEWVKKKRVELTTTKQIETRVKRQIVLEDGKVVDDSGPIVTTNTTEDTDKQESEHTEVSWKFWKFWKFSSFHVKLHVSRYVQKLFSIVYHLHKFWEIYKNYGKVSKHFEKISFHWIVLHINFCLQNLY